MINLLKKNDYVISVAIILFGIIAFAVVVTADTANTSVTVGNAAPVVSAVAMDRTTITIVEGTSIWASTTLTVTDSNGCTDIADVTAKLFIASTSDSNPAGSGATWGDNCTYDGSYCYTATASTTSSGSCTATTTGNTCVDSSDTSAEWDCGFEIWYTATASDGSAPIWDTSIWTVSATATDQAAATHNATNTTQSVEMATVNALSLSGNISYAQTSANSDTGTTDQSITITNTGNTAGDTEISGDVMCTDYSTCVGNYFTNSQQKFDLTASVDYTSKTYTLAATASPATIQTVLVKPTSTTSAVTDITYWGIGIPNGQAVGSYTGQNTLTGVADI